LRVETGIGLGTVVFDNVYVRPNDNGNINEYMCGGMGMGGFFEIGCYQMFMGMVVCEKY